MTLDITPAVPEGRQVIQKYGGGGFRIANVQLTGSVLVTSLNSTLWPIQRASEITLESLDLLFSDNTNPGIILIGCGEKFIAPPKALRSGLKEKGASLEWMDTGAACRTYNVLLIEERQVSAALIAVE